MHNFKRRYLDRYAITGEYLSIEDESDDSKIYIVIPSYDEPDLLKTLRSLHSCDPIKSSFQIIIVFNYPENAEPDLKERNKKNVDEIQKWIEQSQINHCTHLIRAFDLPIRKAGVGLARKIGLDEAVRISMDPSALLVCLDADCEVSSNYLQSLESFYWNKAEKVGCSIYFEHPVDGKNLTENDGIIQYELFLRYFVQAQKWAGLPYGYHTVGSSMAARIQPYCEKGGMNVRKAGEDFYFIHKIIEHGPFEELNTCTVYPSPRLSDRVPFGTGKAIKDWNEKGELRSYSFELFREVKEWLSGMEQMYESDNRQLAGKYLNKYLTEVRYEEKLREIRQKSGSYEVFRRHFFGWFNAFRMMKFARYHRKETGHKNKPVEDAIELLRESGIRGYETGKNAWEVLKVYRALSGQT